MNPCRRVVLPILVAAALASGAGPASADQISITDLIESSQSWSGVEVTVTGEFVGDYGHRRDGTVWAQINDDSYAATPVRLGGELTGSNVGVGGRFPETLLRDLDAPGGYRWRGPLVTVTGTWRHHDAARGGESYLDIRAITVLEEGRPLEDGSAILPRLVGGLALWVASLALWMMRRRRT